MIKLSNVSKFYYNKGVIASGFTKANLELNIGEFVAITGESGSGKSTLLNVISGLDTYEEGEMYINGAETSHYTEKDFENYRREYIGNIYQNFNLINSYTVYQNIELVMMLNGFKKRETKKKVEELLKIVELDKFKNTKVSKLSGGQKQRVAIARALAKGAPIIIADEPTGNLDSESAKNVIEILSKISKDKLIIIVTHNYEQVEKYVTRKITMHDGSIIEDKKIKEISSSENPVIQKYGNLSNLNKLKLGIRNAFNIKVKFLLMLTVYLFVIIALLSTYSSFKKEEYSADVSGYNNYFSTSDMNRIIINKADRSEFTDEDFNNLLAMPNIQNIDKMDILLDKKNRMNAVINDYYLNCQIANISEFNASLDEGRMPQSANETVIEVAEDSFFKDLVTLNSSLKLVSWDYESEDNNIDITVVGIKYVKDSEVKIYLNDQIFEEMNELYLSEYENVTMEFNDYIYNVATDYNIGYGTKIAISDKVEEGKVILNSSYELLLDSKKKITDESVSLKCKTIYYENSVNLKVQNTYDKDNIKKVLGIEKYDDYSNVIFVNSSDYAKLYKKGIYQVSTFVKDVKIIDDTDEALKEAGYNTFVIQNNLRTNEMVQILKIFKAIVMITLCITLFFISYFVIKIILKSRNVYFSTIRMLGATKKICENLLNIELLTITNVSYIITIMLVALVKKGVINVSYINSLVDYLSLREYIIIYVVLILMSLVIGAKFAKKLFKASAIKTYNEEV